MTLAKKIPYISDLVKKHIITLKSLKQKTKYLVFLVQLLLTKNADKDQCKYSGYGIGFNNHENFSLSNGSEFGKNMIISEADMNYSVHDDNKRKIS